MPTADGKKGGMVNIAERISGRMNAIGVANSQPQMSAHKNTGMCIGRSMLPICGICPVRNGSTSPMARNMAVRVRLLRLFFI